MIRALIIGIVQIFALVPGASRSGVTISVARFLGYDRVIAARFSLLLSLPTIAGAGLLKTLDLVKSSDATLGADAVIVAVLSAGQLIKPQQSLHLHQAWHRCF